MANPLRARVSQVSLVALVLATSLGRAEVPSGYYDAASGLTGGELKQALNQIIRRDHRNGSPQHAVISYESLLGPLREIWRDPTNASNISLIYSSSSVDAFSNSWNREHLWPRVRGNSEHAGPDDSDLFHVVPSDIGVNALRGNLYFDFSDVSDPKYTVGAGGDAQFTYDSDSWQPPPEERGDIARALFYMDVRYNGDEVNTTDLDLVSFPPSGSQMAKLDTLLYWHEHDPPDDAERARNDLIYSNYQGNRNPFIDHPEYVADIWGTGNAQDPQNVPLARVRATSSTASESPSSPARFLVSLNQFAGADGVSVNFSMSGTAGRAEYSLAVEGLGSVSYDSSTGLGSVLIPPKYATATIILTPVADGVLEGAETASLTLAAGMGYEFTPDSSAFATVTLRDGPSLPVSWNFDSAVPANKVLPANSGDGFISFSNWGGGLTNFTSGHTSNSLGLVNKTNGNGTSIDFNFSTLGYRGLSLSFWTRGTTTGFTSGLWSVSTNGVDFVTNSATNTATTSTSWQSKFVDFSAFSWLNNASNVTVRYTLSGATPGDGNNRLDDLSFSATPFVEGVSPANDNFADAIALEGVTVEASGSNTGATKQQGEPWHYSSTGGASVWWRWTAPQTSVVSVSTSGSSFDTILAIYTGTSVGSLTKLVSDDDSGGGGTSKVTFSVVAGTTYMIAVDGYGGATGEVALSLKQSSAPAVSAFSPTVGRSGAVVTINGFNFAQATSVSFGSVKADFTVVSDTQIFATVPAGANSALIYVWSPAGSGQSAARFVVARWPATPLASSDRASVGGLMATQGNASASSTFSVSAAAVPGPLRIAVPTGFEVSLDGLNFTNAVEISAPERFDSAANYLAGWTNGANAGSGFAAWSIWTGQGTGSAGALLGNPADSGVTGFGDRAFSLFAGPAASSAYAQATRVFNSPMAVGDTFSFRWALNWDPNTSTGANYFYVYSGGALLFGVHHGNYPGQIYFWSAGSASIDTGIAYGTQPMRWTLTLIDANTLRVSATGRDGSEQILFARDIAVAGAPDTILWYASQIDQDVHRRAYFNDLRIDSASPGGGSFGAQTVHVRLAANAPAGNLGGALDISSGGQTLSSVQLSGVVTGTASAYDTWLQQHGLDPQGNGARGADPDGDGYPNGLEFAFGQSPVAPSAAILQSSASGGALTLRYVARQTGFTYVVQRSSDLPTGFAEATDVAPSAAVSQDGVPTGCTRMEFSVPINGAAFYRVLAVPQ